MAIDVKQYLYTKGVDAVLDADFDMAQSYAKVKPGRQAIFWKTVCAGMRYLWRRFSAFTGSWSR